jgi:hypothetical protein
VETSRAMPATRNASASADRRAVFLSGALLLIGFVVLQVAAAFHPGGDPNDHLSSFTLYANSRGWTADHLGYFAAITITIAGLLVLFRTLDVPDRMSGLLARIGGVLAAVALALTAVRSAVDGVVLKRAVDAWVSAPDPEKAVRFANAETVRWMEEAASSYQTILIGLTLILLAALIIWTAKVPWPIGILLGLNGVSYVAVGWIFGVGGFAPQGALPNQMAQGLPLFAGIYLLIVAWRTPSSTAARVAVGASRKSERHA